MPVLYFHMTNSMLLPPPSLFEVWGLGKCARNSTILGSVNGYAVAPPFTTATPFRFAVLTHTMHRFQRNERGYG